MVRNRQAPGRSSAVAFPPVKAWVVRQLGGPDTIRFEEFTEGEPAAGMVRIRLRASAINYFDSLMIAGQYQTKPDLPFVPGSEVSGVVLSAPTGSGFQPGDRVMALVDNEGLTRGGYGEVADAAPGSVAPMPAKMGFDEAAAFTLIFQTGWFGLHRRANLKAGETLLVHAAAGGVGSAAIQLGKAAGARVIGVVGGPAKAEVARQLGADVVVDRHEQDFVEVVKAETGGKGADVIY